MKKTLSLLLAALLVLGCFAACTPYGAEEPEKTEAPSVEPGGSAQQGQPAGSDPAAPQKRTVINVACTDEPTTLDNQSNVDTSNAQHKGHLFEGLITIIANTPMPGVAETWDISNDGLVWTFHLRKDAKWWDGQPVTAKDFEYGIKRLVDPAGPNGSYAWQGDYLKNGKAVRKGELPVDQLGVYVVDDYTIQLETIYPMPYLTDIIQCSSFYPTRQDYVEQYGKEYATSPETIMGNGPYKLAQWNHEESIIYAKSENYWNKDVVQFETINCYIISDNMTQFNMFEQGELDVLDTVPKESIPDYDARGISIHMAGATGWFLVYNVSGQRGEQSKVLGNVNFRKALSYALDRATFVEAVRGDGSTPLARINADSLVCNNTTWGEKYPNDVYSDNAELDKAMESFNKAMEELGMTAEQVPALTLLVDDRAFCKTSAEIIQNLFKTTFGVTVEINTVTYKARVDSENSGDYDMCITSWAPDYNDAMSHAACFMSTDSYNMYFGGYNNPAYDELIKAADGNTDVEARAELLKQAEDLLLEEMPVVPLYQTSVVWACQEGLTGVDKCSFGNISPNWAFATWD